MGGSPKAPPPQPVPPMPAPIDYDKMAAASIRVAKESLAAEEEAIQRLYPQYIGMQFDTADQLSRNLDNQYLDTQRQAISGEMARYSGPSDLENQLATLGASSMAVRPDQLSGARVADVERMQTAQAGPAAIVQGPQGYSPAEIRAQQINAAQAGPVANVQAASTGAPERVAGTRVAGVGPMQSARVGRVQNVRSRDIQASAAEQALMREASGGGLTGQLQAQAARDLSLGRSLSAEQSRDAIQSARSGAAARGLSTGNSALAAELLNRDRFATQREAERRAFAGNVLNQATGIQQAANQSYLGREDSNAGRNLQASLANQGVAQARAMQDAQFAQQAGLTDNQNAQQRVLAEAGYAQQAGLSNQDFGFRAASQDAQFAQQAALANQQAGLSLGQSNAQLLQQAALANQGAQLQAGQLNQAAASRAAEFQQSEALRAALANQQTDLSLGLTNAQLAQSANAANFAAAQDRAMADAGYSQQAALANQAANQDQVNANRAFLQNVNQTIIGNEAARAQQRLGLAGLYGDLDPYRAALGPAFGLGSSTLGQTSGQVRDIYGGSLAMAGNVESFNTNMAATNRNSILNYNAAVQGAAMQAGAANRAGMMGMIGTGVGTAAGLAGIGIAI